MIKKIFVVLAFISYLLLTFCYANKIEVIKDPKPTHFEKSYVPLKKVNSLNIDFDINNDNFIGRISSTTIDNDGNLFIFDELQAKIFKFSKNLKFIKKFGQKGKGPGEFAVQFSSVAIDVGSDNQLYVSDRFNRRIHVFDLNGRFIKDHKFKYTLYYRPAVSKNGDFYLPTTKKDGIIDVFNKDMVYITTLLARSEFDRFIFRKPDFLHERFLTHTWYSSNIFYNLLPDDSLLVLITNYPTLYILEKFKLVKKFKILPDMALKNFKRDSLKDLLENEEINIPFVCNFFLDRDDYKHFYLQFLKDEKRNMAILYKFSLNGKLINVLYVKHEKDNIYIDFLFKKNNIFYAKDRENIFLYKEEKNED